MVASLYRAEYGLLRDQLRSIRIASGLTQVQLADALGLGQSYVSKVERGANFVDVLLYAKWCEVCGVNAASALREFRLKTSLELPSCLVRL